MSGVPISCNNSSIVGFLNRLSKQLQLLQVEQGSLVGPRVKISLEDKLQCESYKAPIEERSENVVVKQEIETEDDPATLDNEANEKFSLLANRRDVYSTSISETKACALCLQTIKKPACYIMYDISSVRSPENYALRKVFQIQSASLTPNFAQKLSFCPRCFKCMEHFKTTYIQYQRAQKQYQETLLRILCFKKQAQAAAKNIADCIDADDDQYVDDDNFKNSCQSETTVEEKWAEISHTENVTRYGNARGKPIRRRGGLSQEEYIEHRRVQMAGYYVKKKKLDRDTTRQSLNSETQMEWSGEIDTEEEQIFKANEIVEEKESSIDATDTNFETILGHEVSTTEEESSDVSTNVETLIAERSKTDSRKRTKKKGRNTNGRMKIRRRGGLTEEQYQEHRRTQMAGYYIEKKRKLGILNTRLLSKKRDKSDKQYIETFVRNDDGDTGGCDGLKMVIVDAALEIKEETIDPTTITPKGVKKKYDYKGKTIRRRGGLTEEQYQARRRAQSAEYYFERKKRLGILKFGPKPLSVIKKAKLRKAEKIALYPDNLPTKSSSGMKVPVIPIENGRFSYRDVEIAKDDDGKHRCCSCGHLTKSMNVMKQHIAKIHFDKEKGHRCSFCDKSFYYESQLRYHVARHTEKGAGIQCEECGQSFKFYSGYYRHRRSIHQGIKPHECGLCEKKFAMKKDLRKHMESRVHNNFKVNPKKGETDQVGCDNPMQNNTSSSFIY